MNALRGLAAAALIALAAIGGDRADARVLAADAAAGSVLARALDAGRSGDWADARRIAGASGDALVADLVVWRQLRAGEGQRADYDAFIRRWGGQLPGMDALRRAVFDLPRVPNPPSRRPTGAAGERWRQFDGAWRRRDYDGAARLLEAATGSAATLGVPSAWAERRRSLARRIERQGDGAGAYRLASQHFLTPAAGYAYSDLEWLSGWIALRRLRDPARALGHFDRFTQSVETPISLGRGHYWRGRALAEAGRRDAARAAFALAADHPTSFYGQLAAAEIGAEAPAELAADRLPGWGRIANDPVARAAILFHQADRIGLTDQILIHMGESADPARLAEIASLAHDLDRHHIAVRLAKRGARRGLVVPAAYYPVTELAGYVTEVEPALAMAIARQETELNPSAVSRAGARGLMQLMPDTARGVAQRLGEPYSRARLTEDWRYNARLGQRYLAERIRRFGGSYVLAAAAYNAGSHRADRWIVEYGDPRSPRVDVIDWIERIPFNETRNYVQRVIEALYTYRARIAGVAGPMTIRQDLTRGARG